MKLPIAKLPVTILRVRLKTACLSLLFGSVVSSISYGQLPNQTKSSPLNYFARFHGLGYSDGYHSCPNNQCTPGRSRAEPISFSSFYGEPTIPPGGRFHKPAPSYSAYQSFSQPVDMNIYPSTVHTGVPHPSTAPGPAASLHSQPDYSSAIPSHSILLQNEPSAGTPSGVAYPAYPDQRGTSSGEMLPPPQPLRTPNQTRRSIPGTTRLYHANLPSPTLAR